jgi:hypothetical protein
MANNFYISEKNFFISLFFQDIFSEYGILGDMYLLSWHLEIHSIFSWCLCLLMRNGHHFSGSPLKISCISSLSALKFFSLTLEFVVILCWD